MDISKRYDYEVISKFAYSTGETIYSANVTEDGNIIMRLEFDVYGTIHKPKELFGEKLYMMMDYLQCEYVNYMSNLIMFIDLDEAKETIPAPEEQYEDTCDI